MRLSFSRMSLLVGLPYVAGCRSDAAPLLAELELVEVNSVGVLAGDSVQEFAEIMDVEVLSDGSFLVLDRTPSVRWFGLDGEHRGGIQGMGGGPGELGGPVALSSTASGELLIADPPNGRFALYDISA